MQKLLFIGGVIVFFFSCSTGEKKSPKKPVSNYTSVQFYECSSVFSFTAAHKADSVRLVLPDKQITLPHVVSASGAKYQNGNMMFWNKGEEALIEYKDQSYTGCKNNPIEATWQKAKLAGVDFRAAGQEPGWILEISNDKHMQLAYNYGQDTAYTPVPDPLSTDSTTIYRAETEAHKLSIKITREPCTDSMKGTRFPLSVSITLDEEHLRGCGRYL